MLTNDLKILFNLVVRWFHVRANNLPDLTCLSKLWFKDVLSLI